MKIVVLDGDKLNPGDLSWQALGRFGEYTVFPSTGKDQLISHIGDAEIVLLSGLPMPSRVFESCPSIKYIGVLATGYNTIDLDAASKRRIPVTNVPDYGTNAIAQLVFAMLLNISNHVAHQSASVRVGLWNWSKNPDYLKWNSPIIELAGKTIGIFGYGKIGRAVSEIAQAFKMNVLYFSRRDTGIPNTETCRRVSFDALLSDSDIISLHCPLTNDTRNLINRETIGKMKDRAILINTARGPLVDETALREALDCGKVSFAAMDVVCREPILPENPLLGAKNCIITPHIGWGAKETRQRLYDLAIHNLQSFLDGKPVNVVNRF